MCEEGCLECQMAALEKRLERLERLVAETPVKRRKRRLMEPEEA